MKDLWLSKIYLAVRAHSLYFFGILQHSLINRPRLRRSCNNCCQCPLKKILFIWSPIFSFHVHIYTTKHQKAFSSMLKSYQGDISTPPTCQPTFRRLCGFSSSAKWQSQPLPTILYRIADSKRSRLNSPTRWCTISHGIGCLWLLKYNISMKTGRPWWFHQMVSTTNAHCIIKAWTQQRSVTVFPDVSWCEQVVAVLSVLL